MPRVNGTYVRLSTHAWRRLQRRRVPYGAVREAVERPFAVKSQPDGAEVRTVSATVNGRRAWVSVVLLKLDEARHLVVTVYPRQRRHARPAVS